VNLEEIKVEAMKKIIFIFIIHSLWAQPPEWDFNPADYEHIMSVTAVIINEEASYGDVLAAFNEQDECVGVSTSTTIPFGPYAGQEAFLIQVYSNSFSGGEAISFKFYDQELDTVYFILETIDFIQDGISGDLVSPLEFNLSYTNTPPVAGDAICTLDEDTTITLILEAYDEDGDILNYTIVGISANGTTTLSGNVATYIPDINFNGTDSFQFKVNDGQADSNVATVTLVVNAVNDAPYLFAIDNDEIFLGETFTSYLQSEDADGDALIYTPTVSGGNATANIDGNILTIIPQEANVTLNIVITVSDGNATHSISFVLTVLEQQTTCLDNNSDGWCDHFPAISIVDGNATILIQGSLDHYIDSGATCQDQEDGDISHQVEVSGDVVNINIPGTYTVFYDCSDNDENAAQTQHRTVFVIPPTIADINEDGFDDDAFMAGAQSGDANLDGILNVIDLVIYIDKILNGE